METNIEIIKNPSCTSWSLKGVVRINGEKVCGFSAKDWSIEVKGLPYSSWAAPTIRTVVKDNFFLSRFLGLFKLSFLKDDSLFLTFNSSTEFEFLGELFHMKSVDYTKGVFSCDAFGGVLLFCDPNKVIVSSGRFNVDLQEAMVCLAIFKWLHFMRVSD